MPDEPTPERHPAEPMTALAEGAASTHELFMAYNNAGFTRAEALQITIMILRQGMGQTGG